MPATADMLLFLGPALGPSVGGALIGAEGRTVLRELTRYKQLRVNALPAGPCSRREIRPEDEDDQMNSASSRSSADFGLAPTISLTT